MTIALMERASNSCVFARARTSRERGKQFSRRGELSSVLSEALLSSPSRSAHTRTHTLVLRTWEDFGAVESTHRFCAEVLRVLP